MMRRFALRAILGGSAVLCMSPKSYARSSPATAKQPPLFTFGVIADVQWADSEDGFNYDRSVARRYRGAFRSLVRAVDWWRELPTPPSFIAQLGDIIDGINAKLGQSKTALEAALAELERAPCPSVNIVGNHELYNFDRAALAQAPWLRHGDREYYSFAPAPGWRMVILDPYQLALIGHAQEDPRRQESVALIGAKNPGVDPSGEGGQWFAQVSGQDRRFVPYNGGLGREQLAWLRAELGAASAAGERVLILSHVILHPRACGGDTMVWDYPEALAAISSEEAGGCVVAVLCGHDHFGQYHHDVDTGVHHCTFCSPLNKGDEGYAFGLVQVWDDAIQIRGPRVDDLLPAWRGGKPTGRPAANPCEEGVGDACWSPHEIVTLPLRKTERS